MNCLDRRRIVGTGNSRHAVLCLGGGTGFLLYRYFFIACSVTSFAETFDTNTNTDGIKVWMGAALPVAQIHVWR